ncbi:MAG: 5'-3' exonuclease H3TH domain-containing protein, partial [Acidimicrobiia bacterium]
KGSFIDRDAVVEKFGVEPDSIPDWLALVGDAADGLPGLAGWGAKSSGTILSRYGHLEGIPLDESLWDVKVRGAAKLAATLREHIGDALLYRYLAQLRTDVPLPDSLADLKWKGVPRARYEAFCDELGFNRLKERPERWID